MSDITYTVVIGGVEGVYTPHQLMRVMQRAAGDMLKVKQAGVVAYTSFGLMLLELRRVLGSPRAYTSFLHTAQINLKTAQRCVGFAAKFGRTHPEGPIERRRLFEYLHAYDAVKWPTIESIDAKMPAINDVERAISERKLSTSKTTCMSRNGADATGSGDEDGEDYEGWGEDGEDFGDDEFSGELDPDAPSEAEVMARSPVIDMDEAVPLAGSRTYKLTDAGSMPAAVIDGKGLGSRDRGREEDSSDPLSPVPSPSSPVSRPVQLSLADVYEETARRLDAVKRRLSGRDWTREQCEELVKAIDEIENRGRHNPPAADGTVGVGVLPASTDLN